MIYGILLAAGRSRRMGQPKQLLDWHGRPLVRHVAEQALASHLAGLVVVVGAAGAAVRAALADIGEQVQIVENPGYVDGQARSLRVGLAALPSEAAAALVLLADQPLVTPGLIDRILAAHASDPQALAIMPLYQGRRGTPVLLTQRLFAELQALEGDIGAREVLDSHAAEVRQIELGDPALVTDIDTPEDYARIV